MALNWAGSSAGLREKSIEAAEAPKFPAAELGLEDFAF